MPPLPPDPALHPVRQDPLSLSDGTPPPRNLLYTVVMDAPGAEGYRFLGRMLASSLRWKLFVRIF